VGILTNKLMDVTEHCLEWTTKDDF